MSYQKPEHAHHFLRFLAAHPDYSFGLGAWVLDTTPSSAPAPGALPCGNPARGGEPCAAMPIC